MTASDHITPTAVLVALFDRIVRESRDPTGFDAVKWVAQFLDAPSGALGGRRPRELMETDAGRTSVFMLVRRMQSGAYS